MCIRDRIRNLTGLSRKIHIMKNEQYLAPHPSNISGVLLLFYLCWHSIFIYRNIIIRCLVLLKDVYKRQALDIALLESDLSQIKEELQEYGYIKKHFTGKKKALAKSKPLHYVSSDGYDIYVGKNNYQNEELTFKFATGNDWWFHAKKMAGSHVIVKSKNEELPDRTFEEAGRLAAYYSSGRTAPKVEIDYIQKKHVKKPNGSKPGFVVYYTNYSLMIEPNISGLKLLSE